ncbi:MAG: hypothetical protein ABIH03_07170 [Pseudomonadota bacterium]
MNSTVGQYLRLRQICLVAADLAHETELVQAIFGLKECYRDANVARYGLENVLFPVGTDFIEIVSPTRPGTAAGRFLERHGGRYGYMVIMDCDDPEQRQKHCERLGVRTANLIRHDGYLGVQLHPKDTGGAMLEFNCTVGGEDPMGAYAPAGPHWQQAIRQELTQGLIAAEIDCPDAPRFAARWSEILQRPVTGLDAGRLRIELDSGAINFLPASVAEPVLAGIELRVVAPDPVLAAARTRGCAVTNDTVEVCGVRFRLTQKD